MRRADESLGFASLTASLRVPAHVGRVPAHVGRVPALVGRVPAQVGRVWAP
jgi:hypothetical protein